MNAYEMAKSYYERGLWGKERLDALVKAGKLTEQERDEIIKGKDDAD